MANGIIKIVSYDANWPYEFAWIAATLRQALGDHAERIDHIGSTAVPGLVAKDIIDIQVTISQFDPMVERALAALGYKRNVAITADHVPPLFNGPSNEWDKWYFRPPIEQRPMHLHVRVGGRANQRYALLFRDYVRAHPVTASAYGLIKRQLAQAAPTDLEFYYDVKDPVCDIIWDAAEDWARTTAWIPARSDA